MAGILTKQEWMELRAEILSHLAWGIRMYEKSKDKKWEDFIKYTKETVEILSKRIEKCSKD